MAEPVRVYRLSPEELAERYPSPSSTADAARRSWRANRSRHRAAGVDRFGRPLARVLQQNPRALGTNPRASS